MEMENKNHFNLLIMLSGTIVLLIVIFSATYAYFTVDTSNSIGNITVVTTVSNELVPVYYVSEIGDLSFYASTADMLQSGAGTVAASASKDITVNLIGGSSSKPATCTFDFVWSEVVDDDHIAYVPYNNDAGTYKGEYTISLNGNGINYNSSVYDAKQLSDGVIASDSITSSGTTVSKTYNFTAAINNLNVEQYIDGDSYKSAIEIDNVSCSLESVK